MAIEYADREATTRPINLEFHNKSLREMIEAIVKQDQQYHVSFLNGVVGIAESHPGGRYFLTSSTRRSVEFTQHGDVATASTRYSRACTTRTIGEVAC
jgi:hypothetical protein